MSIGYVYALINPSMPNLIKVGMTTKEPEERAKELSAATGVATSFIVAYKRSFNDCSCAERMAHKALEERGYRVSNNREFFDAPLHAVVEIISSLEDVEPEDAVDQFSEQETEDFAQQLYEEGVALSKGIGEFTFPDTEAGSIKKVMAAKLGHPKANLELARIFIMKGGIVLSGERGVCEDKSPDELKEAEEDVKYALSYFDKAMVVDEPESFFIAYRMLQMVDMPDHAKRCCDKFIRMVEVERLHIVNNSDLLKRYLLAVDDIFYDAENFRRNSLVNVERDTAINFEQAARAQRWKKRYQRLYKELPLTKLMELKEKLKNEYDSKFAEISWEYDRPKILLVLAESLASGEGEDFDPDAAVKAYRQVLEYPNLWYMRHQLVPLLLKDVLSEDVRDVLPEDAYVDESAQRIDLEMALLEIKTFLSDFSCRYDEFTSASLRAFHEKGEDEGALEFIERSICIKVGLVSSLTYIWIVEERGAVKKQIEKIRIHLENYKAYLGDEMQYLAVYKGFDEEKRHSLVTINRQVIESIDSTLNALVENSGKTAPYKNAFSQWLARYWCVSCVCGLILLQGCVHTTTTPDELKQEGAVFTAVSEKDVGSYVECVSYGWAHRAPVTFDIPDGKRLLAANLGHVLGMVDVTASRTEKTQVDYYSIVSRGLLHAELIKPVKNCL